MYDQKEMLGQFGDFSGPWTPEQLAMMHMMHKRGLKELRCWSKGAQRLTLEILNQVSEVLTAIKCCYRRPRIERPFA
jgi:hypothetical protein